MYLELRAMYCIYVEQCEWVAHSRGNGDVN